MSAPFCLIVIKSITVRRGEGPDVLALLLSDCPIHLRRFRSWSICRTTIAMLDWPNDPPFLPGSVSPSWICDVVHQDGHTDPYDYLDNYIGSLNPTKWVNGQLRHRFGGYTRFGTNAPASDNVVHLASRTRTKVEAAALFDDR